MFSRLTDLGTQNDCSFISKSYQIPMQSILITSNMFIFSCQLSYNSSILRTVHMKITPCFIYKGFPLANSLFPWHSNFQCECSNCFKIGCVRPYLFVQFFNFFTIKMKPFAPPFAFDLRNVKEGV